MPSPQPASAASGPNRRTRIRNACEPCRRRRRKCNGRLPCTQCEVYGYECRFDKKVPLGMKQITSSLAISADDRARVPSLASVGEHQATESAEGLGAQTASPNPAGAHEDDLTQADPTRRLPFFDPVKGRFSRASGSCVFPILVNQAMGSTVKLRPHSFGWNINLRPEQSAPDVPSVRRFLAYQDVSFYCDRYFEAVGIVYTIINKTRYYERCRRYWVGENKVDADFEALVCGVVSLGSLFSEVPSSAEAQLIEHAKIVLDQGTAYAPGRLSLDQVAAWILRTLYLRLTTRPNLSWFASCATLHAAEAMALHINLNTAQFANNLGISRTQELEETRANLFSCALFLNTLISAEYGRSRVHLNSSTAERDQFKTPLMELAQIMWKAEHPMTSAELTQVLQLLVDLETTESHHFLLKVDVTLHLYRHHIHIHNAKPGSQDSELLLSLFRQGFSSVRILVSLRQPWWNVLSTPFQSLLVILDMDTKESLELTQEALDVLTTTSNKFASTLAHEALQTGKLLISALRDKKQSQLNSLPNGTTNVAVNQNVSSAPLEISSDMADIGTGVALNADWEQLIMVDWSSDLGQWDVMNFP